MIRRLKTFSQETVDRLKSISPVVSSTGGFYNPTKEKYGEFYTKIVGVFKIITIKYNGEITSILKNEKLKSCELSYDSNKNIIKIKNKNPEMEINEELLFTFTGDIYKVLYVKIFGWWDNAIYSEITNYDQTYIPLEGHRTKVEDDDYKLIYEDYKTKRHDSLPLLKENASRKNFSSKLPENYIESTRGYIGLDENSNPIRNINEICKTCFHWKNNYCDHWDAPVKSYGWCKKWKARGRRQ